VRTNTALISLGSPRWNLSATWPPHLPKFVLFLSEYVSEPIIEEYLSGSTAACAAIAEALRAIGPIRVQCMMKDGVPHFTEIVSISVYIRPLMLTDRTLTFHERRNP